MKILALDGSTKSTGWAIFDNANLLDYGCITASSADVINRIYKMTNELKQILTKYPDIKQIIVEEVRPDNGYQQNLKTFKALMYLQASIVFMIHDNFPQVEINYTYPSSWRKSCGITTGRGIRREVLKQADIAFVKNIFNIEVNDDIADSICIGYAQIKQSEKILNFE